MLDELKSQLAGLTAASLTDAMGRLLSHRAHILDLVSPTPGRVLFGRAATINFMPYREDYHEAKRPGFARSFYKAVREKFDETVLVLNNPSQADTSIGGGIKFSRLHNHRVAGLVTDARLRDFDELASYGSVFYCGGEAAQAGSHTLMPIAENVPVTLRGTTIFPGDYIYADRVAAVVIPATHIDRVLALARDIDAQDKADLRTILNEHPGDVRRQGREEA
jgi:regulator of RNase E activity RraA